MKSLALITRDFRRLWQSKGLLVMTFIQPVAYLLIFAVMFARQFGDVLLQGRQIPYLVFIIPGLVALQSYQAFHTQLSLSSGDRRWGILLVITIAGLRPSEYVFGQVAARGLLAALQSFIILAVGLALTGIPSIWIVSLPRLLLAAAAWISSTLLWASLGLLIGIRLLSERKRDVLWALFNLPVMFTSSVFYDVETGPMAIRLASRLNPLTYCANAIRSSVFLEPIDAIVPTALLAGAGIVTVLAACLVVGATALDRQPGG
ncbi:ABC transporter permease [Candidatus Bipolaricaulota bacterium]